MWCNTGFHQDCLTSCSHQARQLRLLCATSGAVYTVCNFNRQSSYTICLHADNSFKAHLAVLYLWLWCHCFPNTVFVTSSLTQPHHCHALLWNITLNSTAWVCCTSWCHSVSQGWSCDILYWRYNMTTSWCGELYSYCSITILWVWFISCFFLWKKPVSEETLCCDDDDEWLRLRRFNTCFFVLFLRSISTYTPCVSRMRRYWTSCSSFGGNWPKDWIGTPTPQLHWRCCQRLCGQFLMAQVSTSSPYCNHGYKHFPWWKN